MTLNIKKLSAAIAAVILAAGAAFAAKPQWVGNTPKELNGTYKFVEIVSAGSSIEQARNDARSRLAEDAQLQEGIRVYRRTTEHTNVEQVQSADGFNETVRSTFDIDMTVDGEKFDLQAVRVDEHIEMKDGMVQLHTLYMVALVEHPQFDCTRLTTSYGSKHVLMSIIPGWGQWYKGSKAKGVALFAAEAAAIAGIVVCENERASCANLAITQPDFATEHSNKANNWSTGRNICIGVAAGIWIYNLIDAAVAKGARRVVVNRADGRGLSITPTFTPDGSAGISLAYRF